MVSLSLPLEILLRGFYPSVWHRTVGARHCSDIKKIEVAALYFFGNCLTGDHAMSVPKMRLLVMVALFPFFFLGGPEYHSARSWQEVWNLGHPLFFSLITFHLFYHWRLGGLPVVRRVFLCLFVTIVLGGWIEYLQSFLAGRVAGLQDLYGDLTGSMIALFVIAIKEARLNFVRVTGMLSGSAMLAVTIFPLATAVMDERRALHDFPLLADFTQKQETGRFREAQAQMSWASLPVATKNHMLRVDFSTQPFSGLSMVYFPRDWREYSFLSFKIYNPGEPVILHCRVYDRMHLTRKADDNRFETHFFIQKGWNDIQIKTYDIYMAPEGRVMDMSEILGIVLFVAKQTYPRTLYLDEFRLE